MMNIEAARSLTQDDHFFRFFMPYVFQELGEAGPNVWLPLNRNYKPLGFMKTEWVDYHDFTRTHAVKFFRNPRQFADIWDTTTEAPDKLWLYSDAPSTRTSYFERLEKLLSRKMPVKFKS